MTPQPFTGPLPPSVGGPWRETQPPPEPGEVPFWDDVMSLAAWADEGARTLEEHLAKQAAFRQWLTLNHRD